MLAGQIVGKSKGRAFLWQGGVMTDLNTWLPTNSGWVLTEARAINALGQIVGAGTNNGQTRAFLLSPVPSQPIVIDSPIFLSAGPFRFRLQGNAGETYVIQASTNLIEWMNLNTNTLTGSSTNCQDTQATNFLRRFYRVFPLQP